MSPEMFDPQDENQETTNLNQVNDDNESTKTKIKFSTNTDIWSCGVILYQLLTKDMKTNLSIALLRKNREEIHNYLKDKMIKNVKNIQLNEQYINLIVQMLQVDPSKRITHQHFCEFIKKLN
jgi:serine/threonine protein kinase